MIIARVVGNIVATQKQQAHEGKKILILQPLDLNGQPAGDVIVALDAVDAGVGDRVLAVQEVFSAMTSVGHVESPIDAAVIGVEDEGLLKTKAFVLLRSGATAGEGLAAELQEFVKARLARHKYPRIVEFVDDLPKNDRGKVDRKLLRARERERRT